MVKNYNYIFNKKKMENLKKANLSSSDESIIEKFSHVFTKIEFDPRNPFSKS